MMGFNEITFLFLLLLVITLNFIIADTECVGEDCSVGFSLNVEENVPPVISNVSATLITSTEAVIIWQTDELANSSVSYGTTTSTILSSGFSTLTTSHLIKLSSLSSSTLYYYNVSSCDSAGNCNISEQFNFTTSETVVSAEAGGGSGKGGVGALTTTTKLMGKGARVAINVEGKIHYVKIIEITNTTVTINISSKVQQATLSIGEEKKFEVTDDNFYDILVRLNGIENNNANITISSIHDEIPLQLFDIRLELENNLIKDFSELVVIVTFENFGTEPTPVSLLFTILNETGKEVFSEEEQLIVETEEVLRKSFEGVDLEKGKYTFILTTLYDVDVVDEFRQEFEVGKEFVFLENIKENRIWYFAGLVLVIILLISLFTIKYLKNKKKRKWEELHSKSPLRKLNAGIIKK